MKAEKTRYFLRYYHPYNNSVSNREKIIEDREKDRALEELAELERIATEYQSPEIQRLIEIGRATAEAFEQMSVSFDWYDNCDGLLYRCVADVESLLKWHMAQEVKRG